MITTVMHFLLLMMDNPAVMRRAREEIDAVVGGEWLPTFSDRPALPYVEAIMSEVLRWSAAVPLSCVPSLDIRLGSFRLTSFFSRLRAGLPHRLMEGDVQGNVHTKGITRSCRHFYVKFRSDHYRRSLEIYGECSRVRRVTIQTLRTLFKVDGEEREVLP